MGEHVAFFLDFENLYRSVKAALNRYVQWPLVVDAVRNLGHVAIQRAYANWSVYKDAQPYLLQAGFELVHVPEYRESKGHDTRMIIDAVTLGAQPHIGTVVLGTGDSDFIEVAYYLRSQGKRVVAFGVQATTSPLLIQAVDRFISYESLLTRGVGMQSPASATLEEADSRLRARSPEARQALVEQYRKALSQRVRMTPHPDRPQALLDFYNHLIRHQGRKSYKEAAVSFQEDPDMRAKYDVTVLSELPHQVFHAYALRFDEGEEGGLWDRTYRLRPEIKSRKDFLDWCDMGLTLWMAKGLGDVNKIEPDALAVILYGQATPPLIQRARMVLEMARKRWPIWPPRNNG